MGNFRIIINAVGGHGDRRNLKDGDVNYGCHSMDCPDCQARDFVAQLKRRGSTVESAFLEHWPTMNDMRTEAACTYLGTRFKWDGTTQLVLPVGEHTPFCGLGDKGGPIVDDLISGIRRGSFGEK